MPGDNRDHLIQTGDWLRRVAAAHRAALERALSPHGLTAPQYGTLMILRREPGLSSADVARQERLTPPTVSVIVRNLEKMGALERRDHEAGGRIQRLFLTILGKRLIVEAEERVAEVEAVVDRALGKLEFIAAMRRLAAEL